MKNLKTVFFAGLSSIFLAFSPLFAQEKAGKPDLSHLKDEKKFAKKKHIPSMITLGKAYIGSFFTDAARRDFKTGIDWIFKAQTMNDAKDIEEKGEWECFFAASLGGYGAPRDLGIAHQQLALLMQKKLDVRVFEDKPDLDLERLRNLTHKSEIGDSDAQTEMGRMVLEANFDYRLGLKWLKKAADNGHTEAGFLYEWWSKNARNHKDENFYDSETTQKWFDKGSFLAALQYIAHDNRLDLKKERKIFDSITQNENINPEIRLKILFQLQNKLKGRERLQLLKQIELYATNIAAAPDYRFIKKISQEYFDMQRKAKTMLGLQQIIAENPFLSDIPLNYEEYKNDFNGDIRPCLRLLDALMSEENSFLGGENIERYRDSLMRKVPLIYEKADNESKIIAFKKAVEERRDLRGIAGEFQHKIREKMGALGMDVQQLEYISEMEKLNNAKFKSFGEAKNTHDKVLTMSNLSPDYQRKLQVFIKQKTVLDVFGVKPSRSELLKIETELPAQKWLYPEAQTLIANFRNNFLDKYEGAVRNGTSFYFYRLARKTRSEDFDLWVYSVTNGKSNLVFKSSVATDFGIDAKIFCTIYESRYVGYQWKESRSEFLKLAFLNGKVEPSQNRGMDKYKSGEPTSFQLSQNAIPNDFSAKGALQSAMTYFLLGFNKVLGM
jgi:hypothetical protein